MPKTELLDSSTLSVSVGEAKDNLSRYIKYVEEGSRVEITRHGKVVAVLLSAKSEEAMTAGDRFMRDLEEFKRKCGYALTNEDVDCMFVRDRTLYQGLRHPEDFED